MIQMKTLSIPNLLLKLKLKIKLKIIFKENTKEIFKTKPITKLETKTENSIYSGNKFECKECHAEFRTKIALNTHSADIGRKNFYYKH